MDREQLYDILYALTAKDKREAALFGNCAPAAREAFTRSLVGDAFPEIWFELPLTGEPWLDFHALNSYEDVAGTQAAFSGLGGVYTDALTWFANQPPQAVRQLALSYDTSAGDVDHPAVQLLVNRKDDSVPLGFLEAAGRPDGKDPYLTFVGNMPQAWYACYVGVFPGRTTSEADRWVRVECIVGDKLQGVYAADGEKLAEHLAQVGLQGVSDEALDGMQVLARSPFPLELQFNIGPDGVALPVVSASVRFEPDEWTRGEGREDLGRLMFQLQGRNLVDGRWTQLVDSLFAKRVTYESESVLLSCFPAFVKLRWRAGKPLDAKAYLLARAE